MYYQSLKANREKQKMEYLQNEMPNVKNVYAVEDENIQNQLKKQIRPESALKLKNFLIKKNKYAARAYFQFSSD